MNESLNRAKIAIEYAVILTITCWAVWLLDTIIGHNLTTLGILPRTFRGLFPGILTAPFIHANFQHLLANTLPLAVLSFLFFFFYYDKKPFFILLLMWLSSGLLTWLIGRSGWHIGASGIIYALAFFLVFAGIFSRKFILIIASVIVIIAYSGLVWGVFPTDSQTSWEGHLSGAISGIGWAYTFRKSLRQTS